MSNVVHENDNYKVEIGMSTQDEMGLECYRIINKKYNLCEAETTILPKALTYADAFDNDLKELSPIAVVPSTPVVLNS